jgi:LysR family transcriptional regulator, transcriptional activator of the cysJI operon
LNSGLLNEVELIESIPKRSIGACSLKSVPLTRAAARFVDIIENKML